MNIFLKKLDMVFEILTPILFGFFGIFSFVMAALNKVFGDKMVIVLCILLMIQGLSKIVDFIGEHKINQHFNFDVAFGIISISMGAIFLAANVSIDKVCLIWGVYEVITGSFEAQHLICHLKSKDKILIIVFIACVLEIVFGTLLVVNTTHEITLHLIIVGIVFMLSGLTQSLHSISNKRRKKAE